MDEKKLLQYVSKINSIVGVLGKTADSIQGKSKEFITLLSAINDGILNSEQQIKGAIEGLASNQFESESDLRKLLITLKVVDKDADKIVSKWRYLNSLSSDQLKASEDYKKILTQSSGKILDIIKDSKDLQGLHEDIVDSTAGVSDNLEDQLDLTSKLTDKFKKFKLLASSLTTSIIDSNDSLSEIPKKFDQLNTDIFSNFNLFEPAELFNDDDLDKLGTKVQTLLNSFKGTDSSIKIDGEEFDSAELTKELTGTISEVKKQIEDEFSLRTKKLKQYIALSQGLAYDDNLTKLSNIDTQTKLEKQQYDEASALILEKTSLIEDLSSKMMDISKLNSDESKLLESQIKSLTAEDKLLLQQYTHSKGILSTLQQGVIANDAQLKVLDLSTSKSEKLSKVLEGIGYSFQDAVGILPYSISRMLGLDSIAMDLSSSLIKSVSVFNAELALTGSTTSAVSAGIKSFAGNLKLAIGPIGMIALGFTAIYALVNSLESKISDLIKNIGISKQESISLNNQMMDMVSSSKNHLMNEEQIIEIQKSQVEKYGQVLDLSKESNKQLIQTAVLAENAYGIMANSAYDVMSAFKTIGADDSLAQQLLADIGYMSDLAGISPNVIAQDLIESGRELSLYFAGYPKQAAKAIIEIRRMGMSLKQAGQIADKMLNIEGFMTDMAELSAMSNGKLNLSKAFDLRMSGDITGMTREIMDQVGSLSEFSKMNEFTQRKLANTLGMEIPDLQKSLKLREMQNSLSEDQFKLLNDNLSTIGDINNMSVENMKAKAEELSSTQRLSTAFNKIKTILYKALVPIIESFSELLASSSGIIDAIGLGFRALGGIIKFLSPIVKGFIWPFKFLANLIGGISDIISSWFEPTRKLDDGIHSVTTSAMGLGQSLEWVAQVLGGILGVGYMAKLAGFGNMFKKIGTSITGMFPKTNLFEKLLDKVKSTKIGTSITEKVEKLNPVTRIKNLLTNKKTTDITDTITNTSSSATESINATDIQKKAGVLDKAGDLIKSAVEKIKSGFSLIKDFIVDASSTIKEVLMNIGAGIGDFIKNVVGGLGEGLSKFQPKALIGVAAFAGLAASLWLVGKAMSQFENVSWESLAKAGAAVVGFGDAMATFGSFAAPIAIGSAALAIGSAALWLFGKAVASVAAGVDIMITSLGQIKDINVSSLLLLGPAMMGISAGIMALTASGVFSGLSKLFGNSGLSQLEKLATLSSPIDVLSNAISKLVDSLQQFSKLDTDLKIDKTENIVRSISTVASEIPEIQSKQTGMEVVSKEEGDFKSNNPKTEISSITSTSSPLSTNRLEKKLDELIEIFNYYANRPAYAVIEDPTIKSINNKIKALNNK